MIHLIYIDASRPNPTFFSVWDIKKYPKYIDGRATTSVKNEDGSFTNSHWNIRIIGRDMEKMEPFTKGMRISVNRMRITNEVYTKNEEKRTYLRVLILDFDCLEAKGERKHPKQAKVPKAKKAPPTPQPHAAEEGEDEDELPF